MLLVISVILNILLSLSIAVLVYGVFTVEQKAKHAMQEWRKWEERFYEAQSKLLEEHNIFVSLFNGKYEKMVIKKRKEEKNNEQ